MKEDAPPTAKETLLLETDSDSEALIDSGINSDTYVIDHPAAASYYLPFDLDDESELDDAPVSEVVPLQVEYPAAVIERSSKKSSRFLGTIRNLFCTGQGYGITVIQVHHYPISFLI